MRIRVKRVPQFLKTQRYLIRARRLDVRPLLEQAGKRGVEALRAATPMDSGEAANAWSYKIEGDRERYVLSWTNSVVPGTAPLVLLLQYGHNTKSGYFIPGRDFINPALESVYSELEARLRREVFG